jgi:hypothetical protein
VSGQDLKVGELATDLRIQLLDAGAQCER